MTASPTSQAIYSINEMLDGLGDTPADKFISRTIEMQLDEFRDANEAVLRYAVEIDRAAQQATEAIANGHNLNDLGVVQSSGLSLDRACALRQAAANHLRRSAGLLTVSNPDISKAILAFMAGGQS